MKSEVTENSTRQWFIVGRWEEYFGEGQTNLIRVCAVTAYYAVHLINFANYESFNGQARPASADAFHTQCTYLAVGWLCVSLGVFLALQRRFFPQYLKYVVAALDLLLLSALLYLNGTLDTPITTIYFLLIGLAGIRFSLSLVWLTTLGSLISYFTLVLRFDDTPFDAQHSTPVINQLMMLVGLLMMGMVVGQIVRRVRRMAEDFLGRMQAVDSGAGK